MLAHVLQQGRSQVADTVPPHGGISGENKDAVASLGHGNVVAQWAVQEGTQGPVELLLHKRPLDKRRQRRVGRPEQFGEATRTGHG